MADRAKARDLAGRTVTLKLRRRNFSLLSRRHSLREPTQMAETLWREGQTLLASVTEPGPFRLIGIGLSDLASANDADRTADLLDPEAVTRAEVERAADRIRAKFGPDAIVKGRSLR